MTAANDNLRTAGDEERASLIDRILEEFDLLCLGFPSPERITRELACLGVI